MGELNGRRFIRGFSSVTVGSPTFHNSSRASCSFTDVTALCQSQKDWSQIFRVHLAGSHGPPAVRTLVSCCCQAVAYSTVAAWMAGSDSLLLSGNDILAFSCNIETVWGTCVSACCHHLRRRKHRSGSPQVQSHLGAWLFNGHINAEADYVLVLHSSWTSWLVFCDASSSSLSRCFTASSGQSWMVGWKSSEI